MKIELVFLYRNLLKIQIKELKHIIENTPTFLLLIRKAFQSSWNSFLTLNNILIMISGNPSRHWIWFKGSTHLQFLRCSHAEAKKKWIQLFQWFFGILDANSEILSNFIFLLSEVLQWWVHTKAQFFFLRLLGSVIYEAPPSSLLGGWQGNNQYLSLKDFSEEWFSYFCYCSVFYCKSS